MSASTSMNAETRTSDLARRNPRLKDELLAKLHAGQIPELERYGIQPDRAAAVLEGRPVTSSLESAGRGESVGLALEAIVRRYGRPVLLVQDDSFATPDLQAVRDTVEPHRARLEDAITRVGRVEFVNHAMPWGGTGWLVDRNIVVTNRHVAEIVAEADGRGGFRFRTSPGGMSFGAKLDFGEEYQGANRRELPLKSVRYLARTDQPDVALLEIDVDGQLPDPLTFADGDVTRDQGVAIIGYPAYDSRNDAADIARYFGDIFDVKRLAPGTITQVAGTQPYFMHDATTLGGNSGSLVLDMATGRAVGLHYAGTYLVGNYAVTAEQVKRALRGLKVIVPVPAALAATRESGDGTHAPAHFKGRKGYRADFLGTGTRRVPLPGLGAWESDAEEAREHDGRTTRVVPYTHFSVTFSRSRRIPIFTAVNIDGGQSKTIKRSADKWFFDLRLPRQLQLTKTDYGHPDIDRGHMVRREDPNWGSPTVAQLANDDTFHYTNAAPQHAKLNQGKAQWLGLEEYVLGSARTHTLKISVFTGPVMRDDDRSLDNGVKVPDEFWKVVVAIDAKTKKIRATGYVLSQGRLIQDITEAFVYGAYRTYQVPIATIAQSTKLDFGALVNADPLRKVAGPEGLPGVPPVVPLDRLDDMVL